MLRFWLTAATALAMMTGVAAAQMSSPVGPTAPQSTGVAEPIKIVAPPTPMIGRASAPAEAAGSAGSMGTATAPGSGGESVFTDSGIATETIVPGQPPKLVSTAE
jgi:hypothetical protein